MSTQLTKYTELQLIPMEYRTEQLCKEMVRKEIYNIVFVPDSIIQMMDENMSTIRDNYLKSLFSKIPNEYKTQDMCNKAVDIEPLNLEFVPDEYKTVEIINNAFSKNKRVIHFIPPENITYEMYLATVCDHCGILDKIPEIYKTKEIFEAAASRTSKTLADFLSLIPEDKKDFIDENLYISWLKSTGMNGFDQIPEDVKVKSFYEKTLPITVKTLKYMPVEMFDHETMKIELAADFHSNFEAIPTTYITQEIRQVYESTSDFWITMLKESGYSREVFEKMPEKYKTELVIKMFAFKKDIFD